MTTPVHEYDNIDIDDIQFSSRSGSDCPSIDISGVIPANFAEVPSPPKLPQATPDDAPPAQVGNTQLTTTGYDHDGQKAQTAVETDYESDLAFLQPLVQAVHGCTQPGHTEPGHYGDGQQVQSVVQTNFEPQQVQNAVAYYNAHRSAPHATGANTQQFGAGYGYIQQAQPAPVHDQDGQQVQPASRKRRRGSNDLIQPDPPADNPEKGKKKSDEGDRPKPGPQHVPKGFWGDDRANGAVLCARDNPSNISALASATHYILMTYQSEQNRIMRRLGLKNNPKFPFDTWDNLQKIVSQVFLGHVRGLYYMGAYTDPYGVEPRDFVIFKDRARDCPEPRAIEVILGWGGNEGTSIPLQAIWQPARKDFCHGVKALLKATVMPWELQLQVPHVGPTRTENPAGEECWWRRDLRDGEGGPVEMLATDVPEYSWYYRRVSHVRFPNWYRLIPYVRPLSTTGLPEEYPKEKPRKVVKKDDPEEPNQQDRVKKRKVAKKDEPEELNQQDRAKKRKVARKAGPNRSLSRCPNPTLTMQGFNMGRYVPPEHEGTKTGNALHNKHALGARASKLRSDGALVVRFEMPYAVWCATCPRPTLIGQGVRFNAEKRRAGRYHSTPVWSFRMRHAACGGTLEMRTDPQNTAYVVVSGGTRRDTGDANMDEEDEGGVAVLTEAQRQALRSNAFASLEKTINDREQLRETARRIDALADVADRQWHDPYARNQKLRSAFRVGRKERAAAAAATEALQERMGLGLDILPETREDAQRARLVDFGRDEEHLEDGALALAKPLFETVPPKERTKEPRRTTDGSRESLATQVAGNTRAAKDPFLLSGMKRAGHGQRAGTVLGAVKRKRDATTRQEVADVSGQSNAGASKRAALVEYDSE
ncbi:DUF572 domain-containing protein [Cordyceps militaris CM01]|uniref:DUF572 domain-containing protein n=1 Tax=Cordyceps militaris (strain CM01) TaxID=983644 RepID=G3JDG2_CORMM|nr:DUF572 domain-containing protein [Cordyceps militaris CM01]EGX92637.1 DUF572 domain-containing protein [Cordyceps militaris CM01]